MLYDPKWDIKANPYSLSNLIAWLQTMPPEREYNFGSCQTCALAQYYTYCGFKAVVMGATTFFTESGLFESPEVFDEIAREEPYTFGAALERAKARLIP